MRLNRFYTPDDLPEQSEIWLEGDLANYVGKVLRMKAGQKLHLFNGSGSDLPAEILSVEKKRVQVQTGGWQPVTAEPPFPIHLGQVMSRGDRMDYAVQKAVELGVSEITPLSSQYCEVRLDQSRATKRQHHWQQVAISACEQSGRASVPVVRQVQSLTEWAEHQIGQLKLVLHPPRPGVDAIDLRTLPSPASCTLLIGPEGGLSDAELSSAEQAGFSPLALGPRILRTETAPIAVISVLQWLWGDFR